MLVVAALFVVYVARYLSRFRINTPLDLRSKPMVTVINTNTVVCLYDFVFAVGASIAANALSA